MKLSLCFIFFLGSLVSVKAQGDKLLPVDERGKFIYYEVVELKTLSKDSINTKVLHFLKQKTGPLSYRSAHGDSAFSASGKFIISKTLMVMSHPSGEIPFRFEIEMKDGKYRFWLTDFTFIPYQRDRYGNFVPSGTIGIPLENDPGKLNVAQWQEYQSQTRASAEKLALEIKQYMAGKAPSIVQAQEKKVINKSWR